ncbi:epithelial-stromal interaction protein 1 isoform X8 [Marmota marmota marmota]|uniref:epithelial-stromal interaction protein 1 isoform X8 n=1 Tax=Marmota marmota marmota TaxID=9994 RepID=UPI002091EEAA|nr:epithelial-stromal interaction protein 1 isoform X8 [Marmota marmota marmota]
MYTRSKVVGSRLGATPASQDPSGGRGELGPLQSQRQGVEAAPGAPSRESLGHAGQRSTTAAFLSKLDAELPNRSAYQTAPRDLQFSTQAGNRTYKDSLREKENQRLQKMKDEQQQKRDVSVLPAMQHKSGRGQSPPPGCSQYRSPVGHPSIPSESSFRSTANPAPVDPTHVLSQNKLLETKQQQQEEERARILQAEHRRVNNAFLDRLQGKSQPGGLGQSGGYWNTNCGNSWDI